MILKIIRPKTAVLFYRAAKLRGEKLFRFSPSYNHYDRGGGGEAWEMRSPAGAGERFRFHKGPLKGRIVRWKGAVKPGFT